MVKRLARSFGTDRQTNFKFYIRIYKRTRCSKIEALKLVDLYLFSVIFFYFIGVVILVILRCANAELCKTRSNCEQENEMLKTKLETLMSEISENDKVKKLVENIETQRDRYKSHMENLLQDIQNNKGYVT